MAGTAERHTPHVDVHDRDHQLGMLTLGLAAVGAVLLIVGLTAAGTVLGGLGLLTGLVAQMMSSTRGERWVDILGILAAFLVLAIGAAQGGLP
jgi:hypothetical protein